MDVSPGLGLADYVVQLRTREKPDMLRITKINANGAPIRLKLEGKISAEWVALLERECLTVLTRQPQLILDMTNVTYIDGHGVAMLRSLPHPQISFIHRSRFLQELLDKGDQP